MNSLYKTISHDVIDLTESFSLPTPFSSNTIIELDTTDESINTNDYLSAKKTHTKKVIKSTGTKTKQKRTRCAENTSSSLTEPRSRQSECPICWTKLGKNPLASTICGHVYCLKCLEQSLKVAKKCPTCRHVLTKKNSYHPLFLNF